MTTDALEDIVEFGETTVTSKGQITLPSALPQALNPAPGDRIRFKLGGGGEIAMPARKRRGIVDIAKANPIRLGKKGVDLDKLIDEAVGDAMADRFLRGAG